MEKIVNKPYRPFVVLLAIFVSVAQLCFAQDQITELDEIEITASPLKKFGVGATVTKLDSSIIENYSQTSLATLLTVQSPVYIKQYGAGMLSTISFRGTGAGHTVVRWNGMQVGYPFLGQSDLSLLPLDFTSEVSLVHGSSSSRYGTGAIGGIIDLKAAKPQTGLSVIANQSLGSFGTSNSTLQVAASGLKGFVKVSGIYNQSENNFPFKSSTGKPLGYQENASYSMQGVQLESAYFINSNSSISLSLQSINADRNLQPSIVSNANDNQIDNNFWSSLTYTHKLEMGQLKAQYGFLYDKINYNGSITDSEQHKSEVIIEYDFTASLSAELGVNATWAKVFTPFYENGSANEDRSNIYASLLWRLSNKLDASFNFRQGFVSGYSIPFTPSVGLDYNLLTTSDWKLDVKSQLAKGYKVPTLNDHFWVGEGAVGNKDLAPEESINAEIGFGLRNNGNIPFWITTTTYKLWVDNWILWLPNGANWSPENKRKVKGFGLEVEMGFEKSFNGMQLKGWLNYAYTKSTNLLARDEYDRTVGKQLPYVPFHNGNITGQLKVGQWQVQANAQATGKRFTTGDNANENKVSGYVSLNIQTSYNFNINQWSSLVYLDVNNITNTNYQSIINRAMPGINFLGGVKINFNK